eukprot:TRINITY_DN3184_c0_g1_i2.p1 TRINITY_DN3184_c0_g1~~TRINITY_DN3184_c0_g1_i2.p1  ORF type:complete len:272 (+),score=65.23 TRINITY_DN3184_c0_g1_i2:97-912(+)
MIRRPPRSTQSRSSAASDVYKRQISKSEMNAKEASCAGKEEIDHAVGWQIKNGEADSCRYLALVDSTDSEKNVVWSFLSQRNPAYGVQLKFTDGEVCHQSGTRRSIALNFRCLNHASTDEDLIKVFVQEPGHCEYEINFDTPFGCPTECGYGGGQVPCGEHGTCGFDQDAQRSRCFCNVGWTGAGCGDQVSPPSDNSTSSGWSIAAFIIVLLAVIGFGTAGYFFFRWMQGRTINLSGDSYSKLEAQYGDSMVGAHEDGPTRMTVRPGPADI